MGWARQAGVDLLADRRLAARLEAALRAPGAHRAARPHLPRPQGLALRRVAGAADVPRALGGRPGAAGQTAELDLWDWLRALYAVARRRPPSGSTPTCTRPASSEPPSTALARRPLLVGAAGDGAGAAGRAGQPWQPGNTLLESQGLAILRRGDRYASLECGAYGGGHGHPDRLHLTLHAERPALAARSGHRLVRGARPLLVSLDPGAQRAAARRRLPAAGRRGVRGLRRVGRLGLGPRAVRASSPAPWSPGPRYLLDVVELSAPEAHTLELPWHLNAVVSEAARPMGAGRDRRRRVRPPTWSASCPATAGALRLQRHRSGRRERWCSTSTRGPSCSVRRRRDCPAAVRPLRSTCCAREARESRLVSVIEASAAAPVVRGWRVSGELSRWRRPTAWSGTSTTSEGWEVTVDGDHGPAPGSPATGARRPRDRSSTTPAARRRPAWPSACRIRPRSTAALDGFDVSEPLELDHEDQYRRSEEPTPAPRSSPPPRAVQLGRATASTSAWTSVKPELVIRDAAAAPLRLDNEPDDIHADGVQVYVRPAADASGVRLPRRAFGRGRQHSRASRRRAPRAIRPWCAARGSPPTAAIR